MIPSSFKEKLLPFHTNRFASISYLKEEKIAICQANAAYIPIQEFQALFEQASELIVQEGIDKFIFDKRKLTVFHQPSMEWYHVVWKQQMLTFGLTKHRKLIQADKVFEQSIITGKKLIQRKYPAFDFTTFDIRYCQNLQEANEQ